MKREDCKYLILSGIMISILVLMVIIGLSLNMPTHTEIPITLTEYSPPPIPGFPFESIIIAVLLVLGIVLYWRRKK